MMMSDIATTSAPSRSAQSTAALAVIVVLLVAACATTAPISGERPGVTVPPAETPSPVPQAPPLPRNVEPPPPKLNLSGFPLPYRQGYADGCASANGAERKDAARYSSDMNYRTGWSDGRALCTKK
jgi:hypothetical protein